MIIVKLMGGLGNQMFQYALGRTLSFELNTRLKFEVSSFEKDFYKRVYQLKYFNLETESIEVDELERLLNGPKDILSKAICGLFHLKPYSLIYEKGFDYNTNISQVSCNVYLIGYWQSERYFIKYKDLIKKDFVFKNKLSGLNMELAKEIENTNSVCVHFRRLHGISRTGEIDKKGINFHGASSMEYYKRAISIINEKIEEPHYFVFSDDFKFAEENLKLNYPTTFVTNNDDEHCYNDLRLMSLCKHQIIANSSFSWWGAWLNDNLDKIVIAPKVFFAEEAINLEDRFPEKWITI
jgi:hypothetical protein